MHICEISDYILDCKLLSKLYCDIDSESKDDILIEIQEKSNKLYVLIDNFNEIIEIQFYIDFDEYGGSLYSEHWKNIDFSNKTEFLNQLNEKLKNLLVANKEIEKRKRKIEKHIKKIEEISESMSLDSEYFITKNIKYGS